MVCFPTPSTDTSHRRPYRTRRTRNVRNAMRLVALAACVVSFSRHVFLNNADGCPTLRDLESTLGTDFIRNKIWNDRSCRSGCILLPRTTAWRHPICTVTKQVGLRNAFLFTCLKQVDNYFLTQLGEKNQEKILKYCQDFLSLEPTKPTCDGVPVKVPSVVHTISKERDIPFSMKIFLQAQAGFRHHHESDASAFEYIRDRCSLDLAKAYQCIKPPAFRADLYRFCALFAEGGIYLDVDIVSLVPIEELFSRCSAFTLGYDQAQGRPEIGNIGMQMKILASEPGSKISSCMLMRILDNVKNRRQFRKRTLEFSGPQLLKRCYEEFSKDVAITYVDTRGADWPYTGLRVGSKILAYEKPSARRHFPEIVERDKRFEYNDMVQRYDLYDSNCKL